MRIESRDFPDVSHFPSLQDGGEIMRAEVYLILEPARSVRVSNLTAFNDNPYTSFEMYGYGFYEALSSPSSSTITTPQIAEFTFNFDTTGSPPNTSTNMYVGFDIAVETEPGSGVYVPLAEDDPGLSINDASGVLKGRPEPPTSCFWTDLTSNLRQVCGSEPPPPVGDCVPLDSLAVPPALTAWVVGGSGDPIDGWPVTITAMYPGFLWDNYDAAPIPEGFIAKSVRVEGSVRLDEAPAAGAMFQFYTADVYNEVPIEVGQTLDFVIEDAEFGFPMLAGDIYIPDVFDDITATYTITSAVICLEPFDPVAQWVDVTGLAADENENPWAPYPVIGYTSNWNTITVRVREPSYNGRYIRTRIAGFVTANVADPVVLAYEQGETSELVPLVLGPDGAFDVEFDSSPFGPSFSFYIDGARPPNTVVYSMTLTNIQVLIAPVSE